MDSARHVMRFHLCQETRVYNAEDDVASTTHQFLSQGGGSGGGCGRRQRYREGWQLCCRRVGGMA